MSIAVYRSDYFRTYADLAALEAGLAAEIAAGKGQPRAIRCQTAGILAVRGEGHASTDLEDLYFLAGETQIVGAAVISDGDSSGCVPVTLYW